MAGGKTSVLLIRILGDSSGATKALSQVDAAVNAVDASVSKGAGKWLGWGAAAAAAVVLPAKAASDLEQAIGSLDAVFQEQADEILAWAEGMAQYGISTAASAQAAAILGSQLINVGIPMEQAAALTTQLIELSVDLAYTFGTPVTQAINAVGAALRGEFEPLEKYGIGLTAATVEAQALILAEQGLTFETERQAKVVATLTLIQEQSTAAQGQADREMGNLANTTQRLMAETVNLVAEIGGFFLPILSTVIGTMAELVHGFGEAIDETGALSSVMEALASILESVWTIVEPILIPALELLNNALQILADFIDTYVMPILEGLEQIFDRIAQALERVIDVVQDAVDWFQNLADSIHEAADSLTFWNDNYQEALDQPPLPSEPAPSAARAGGQPIVFNINTGVGDPHAIAKQIRKLLAQDAARLGRAAPLI